MQGFPQSLGELARRRSHTRREQQCGVRRVVAELHAAGALQSHLSPSAALLPRARVGVSAAHRLEHLLRNSENDLAQSIQRGRRRLHHGARRLGALIVKELCHGSVRGACDTSYVNDQDPGAERHINIHLSPEIMGGVYANFANVSHSDYEFTVTFARVDHEVEAEEVPGVVVSRVNLSPRFMRELIDAMEDNYSKWRTREGIKNLPEYGGTEAVSDEE